MGVNDFATDDGEEQYDDDPAITLGDLRAGERVTLKITEEPETFESDEFGEGVRFPAMFVESDYRFTDDGDEIEGGDHVVLLTWSKRLVRSVKEYAGGDVRDAAGDEVTIEKSGSGYDTDYVTTAAGE